MTSRWSDAAHVPRGDDYDARWRALAAAGQNPHGEADFVERLWERMGQPQDPQDPEQPERDEHGAAGFARVLDAGCGTGRLAIELDRRGFDVTGVDLDPTMLESARSKSSSVTWHLADLSDVRLASSFDVVVLAGNVMIFLAPGTEAATIANLAEHLRPGGLLVAGFERQTGRLQLDEYDQVCDQAGLTLHERHSTWDDDPFEPARSYAVSVHRLG